MTDDSNSNKSCQGESINSLFGVKVDAARVDDVPVRLLAYLGDAVFELFERERAVLGAVNADTLHKAVVSRVNASAQSAMLEVLKESLSEKESDIVRRARNLKVSGPRRADQAEYRRATAFEALVGYLYLTNQSRLSEILDICDRSRTGDHEPEKNSCHSSESGHP